MNKSLKTALLIVVLMAGWMVAFWFTRTRAIAAWQQDNPAWLDNVSNEIIQTEEDFLQWTNENKEVLRTHRLELAQLLEDPESADTLIIEKVAQIEGVHETLLRGVCRHLKSMRTMLPQDQKELLRGFCMQSMQGGMHRRGRGFQMLNSQEQNTTGPGPGMGNGFRWGQRNGSCGLTRKLQLTDEQLSIAREKDPAFEEDVRELRNQLFAERQALLSLFESGKEMNGQLTEQFDRLINAYNTLEKRLIAFVLTMRPYFTTEQQKQIIGLCKKNCMNDANADSFAL